MHIVIDEEHMRMISTYLIMVPFASCAALRLAGIAAQWLCSDLHIFRQRSRLSWLSIAFIELLVVLLALLLFGLSSGLVHILAPLSVIIGILSGWSVRSMRMIGICAFTGLCLVVPSLLSRCVVVQLEADTATWDHPPQYRGAHVQLSMMSSSSRLSPPPHLFMYYDDMRFDLYLDSFSGRPTRRKDAAFQPPVAAADGDSDSKQQQQPGVRGLAQHPEQHVLVSVGQRTAIAGFAPSTSSSVSRVVIAGDGSTVSNTALHCAVHNSKEKEDDNDSDSDEGTNSDGNTTKRGVLHASPCFAAAASVQMKNVTFNFVDASTSSSFHAPSLHIDTARSCQDAAERYEVHRLRLSTEGVQLPSGLIRCRKKHMSGGGSSSGDLNAFLTEVSVPQSFYDGIPLSLAWRWYLPDYTRRAQEALQVILDEVLAPGATLFMRYANIAYVFTAELCEYAVERTHAGMPYVVAFMRRSGSVALGALCGDHGEWLSLCTTTHRDEQSYRLGVDIHKALLSFIYTLQETLELVPGAWAAVGWCWRMEWLLVRWIVQFCYSCVAWLAAVVPILEPVYVWRVLCTLGRYLLVSAYFLSTVAAEVLSSFWKMGPVRWVVMEEVREIGLEMDLLQAMAHSTWGFLVLLARELWLLCTVSFACCSLGLSYYSRLSLSIHLTMVLLQTALLVVAVRNEIRDELLNAAQQTEEEESRANNANQGRSFFNPRALFQRFRRNAVVTKLNGIALFVKAHSYTSLQYFIQHGVLLIVLVGLSVLPFSNKLYKLVLHVVLPWISSQCFLSFFHGLRPPPYAEVFALCVVKALVGIALQNTIGDFLYRFLWDLAIIVGVFAAIVLAMWAWPRRVVLARQVAEAVSDSLRQTPMRGSPSGSRAASVPMTPMNEGLHGHVQQTPTGGEEGVGAVLFAAAPPAGGVEADT